MALKTYKPTTPSQRQLVLVDRSASVEGQAGQGADRGPDQDRRAQQSRPRHRCAIAAAATSAPTAWSISSARKLGMPATVERLEYDPNRTAFIALIKYEDGELSYILAPQRLARRRQGDLRREADVKPGNAMPLAQHADRHHRPQRRDEARQRRPDRPRSPAPMRSSSAAMPGYAHPAAQFRRDAHGAGRVHGHGRRGVQSGPFQHLDRQGRPQCAGRAASPSCAAWR